MSLLKLTQESEKSVQIEAPLSLTSSLPTVTTEFPPHLRYISGPKAKLFLALIDEGILDPYGNITPPFANRTLPALTSQELSLINAELHEKFCIQSNLDTTYSVSIIELLRDLYQKMPQQSIYQAEQACLIGGYVTYILFNQTDYVKRVFETLGISKLYDPSLINKNVKAPLDIDLRMHVRKQCLPLSYCQASTYIPPSTRCGYADLKQIQVCIINNIAHLHCMQRKERSVSSVAYSISTFAFDILCTVCTPLNTFQVMSFKNSKFDWILYDHLNRLSVFTIDDLYLSIDCLVAYWQTFQAPVPQSFRGTPLQSFFQNILDFIQADHPESIDEKGWLRFIANMTKGKWSAQLNKTASLEYQLYSTMCAAWNSTKFNEEIKKWIDNHHKHDTIATLFFILNAALHLRGHLATDSMHSIVHLLPLNISTESTVIASFRPLIIEKNLPVSILADFLQVCAFLKHARNDQKNDDSIAIEIASEDFERPVIQFKHANHSLQFPCEPADALKRLVTFQKENSLIWQEAEITLIQIFLSLCPPTSLQEETVVDPHIIKNLDVSDNDLDLIANELTTSCSILLCYIGFVFQLGSSQRNEIYKKDLAERLTLQFMRSSAFPTEKKESIKKQLEIAIGKDSIPLLDDDKFEEKWISLLFAEQRNSQENGYQIWKEMASRGDGLAFSLQLIAKLVRTQPGYALRLFSFLYTHTQFAKMSLEAVNLITKCITTIQGSTDWTIEHKNFVDYMTKSLPEFLQKTSFTPPDNEFVNSIIWLAKYKKRKKDYNAAATLVHIGKSYDCHNKDMNSLHFQLTYRNALRNDKLPEIKQLLNQLYDQKLLDEEKRLIYLVRYFEKQVKSHNSIAMKMVRRFQKGFESNTLFSKPKYYEEICTTVASMLQQASLELNTKLTLIDLMIAKSRYVIPELLDSVYQLCASAIKQSEIDCELVCNFLIRTTFFDDTISKNCLQDLLLIAAYQLTSYDAKYLSSKWILHLKNLMMRYPTAYPTNVDFDNVWANFFNKLQSYSPEDVLPMYRLVAQYKLCNIKENKERHRLILSQAIFNLANEKNEKILTLLQYPEIFASMIDSTTPQEDIFSIYGALIITCTYFIPKSPSFTPQILGMLKTLLRIFSSVMPDDHADTWNAQIVQLSWTFICTLFAQQEQTFVDMALEVVKESILHLKERPTPYWNQWGRVIPYLLKDSHIETLDGLLSLTSDAIMKDMDYEPFFFFLQKHTRSIAASRSLKAMQLWGAAMRNGWNRNTKSWRYGNHFIKQTLKAEDPAFHQDVMEVFNLIHHDVKGFEKSIGKDLFCMQLAELHLLLIGQMTKKEIADKMIEELLMVMSGRYNYMKGSQEDRNLFDALPKAIVNSARFDTNIFQTCVKQYWDHILVKTDENEKMNDKVICSKEQCFSLKYHFLMLMLDRAIKQSDCREILTSSAAPLIKELSQQFNEQAYEQKILELKTSYRAGLTALITSKQKS